MLQSISELENSQSMKQAIQLPKVAQISVDYDPLFAQADNLRLETRYVTEKNKFVEAANKRPVVAKKSHHRLPLNDVFQPEVKFDFKLDVSKITHYILSSIFSFCRPWLV